MCTQYVLHPPTGVVFYLTDVALPPLVFGLGVAGNLLLLLVLNLRQLRRDSAVYVYLAAMAGVDLFALLCAVPPFVRDVELLPVPLAHSRPAASAIWVRRAVEPILRHSAAWYAALAVIIRYATVGDATVEADSDTSDRPSTPESSSRWTRISSSRIVAFVIFVACALLDFTRFFDAAVVPLVGHCFNPEWSLWAVNRTHFAVTRPGYAEIQPATSALAGGAVPLATAALFAVILWLTTTGCSCCRRRSDGCSKSLPIVGKTRSACLHIPTNHDEREYQLTVTVVAIVIAAVCLDGPRAALDVAEAFHFGGATANDVIMTADSIAYHREASVTATVLYYVELVSRCLSLMRCAVNFVIIATMQYDFRKTLRRSCCCCCQTSDDIYYEPVACCCRSSFSDSDEAIQSNGTGGHRTGNRKDWMAVSSLTSSSTSSRKQDNRGTRKQNSKSPRPSADEVAGDVSHVSASSPVVCNADTAFYCDVDDDRALWI